MPEAEEAETAPVGKKKKKAAQVQKEDSGLFVYHAEDEVIIKVRLLRACITKASSRSSSQKTRWISAFHTRQNEIKTRLAWIQGAD